MTARSDGAMLVFEIVFRAARSDASPPRPGPPLFASAILLAAGLGLTAGCHSIGVAHHRAIKSREHSSGEELVQRHCVKCHSAEPTSIYLKLHNQTAPPFEPRLRFHYMPREYLTTMIRDGGPAVGRHFCMPRWREVFTDEEIDRIVDYLTSVAPPSPEPAASPTPAAAEGEPS